jgi:two-component system cell cycle response regulator DivK
VAARGIKMVIRANSILRLGILAVRALPHVALLPPPIPIHTARLICVPAHRVAHLSRASLSKAPVTWVITLETGSDVLILIAEDIEDTRELMTLLLERNGYEVMTATNGRQAIIAVAARMPDVILMDVGMPEMDGLEATRALRSAAGTRDIPIIVMSAYMGDAGWRKRAFDAGCTECHAKPVDCESLLTLLKRYPTPLQPSPIPAL